MKFTVKIDPLEDGQIMAHLASRLPALAESLWDLDRFLRDGEKYGWGGRLPEGDRVTHLVAHVRGELAPFLPES